MSEIAGEEEFQEFISRNFDEFQRFLSEPDRTDPTKLYELVMRDGVRVITIDVATAAMNVVSGVGVTSVPFVMVSYVGFRTQDHQPHKARLIMSIDEFNKLIATGLVGADGKELGQ